MALGAVVTSMVLGVVFVIAEVFVLVRLYPGALWLYKLCLRLQPRRKALFLSAIGFVHERRNDPQRAIDLYRQAVVLEPERATYYFDLARMYESISEPTAAVENYQKALTLGSQFADAFRERLRSKIEELTAR